MLSVNRIAAQPQTQQPTFEGKNLPKSAKKAFQLNETAELLAKEKAFSLVEGDTTKYTRLKTRADKQFIQDLMINDLFTRFVNKFLVKDTIKFLDKNIAKK